MLYWNLRDRYVPYQSIIYNGRVLLRGRDRTEAYRLVFPSPPIGKTILDIGCHSGFYCFMAASEGAADCVGLDIDAKHLSRAESVLKRRAVANVHFINTDALRYRCSRTFDVVLCLNVLQHFKTPNDVEALLAILLDVAKAEIVLIFPTTTDPTEPYTIEFINGKRYLLLSVNYIRDKVQPFRVLHTDLPAQLYGPKRVLAHVVKLEQAIQTIPRSTAAPPRSVSE
jgi:2-polyprenyl-3-methyl-5-hydroxy-6-metoxy-1,4-benzoquinol methylase